MSIQETKQQNDMYQSYDPTQINKWYNNTKMYTFDTEFIRLEMDEAKALIFMGEYYRSYKKHQIKTKQKLGKGIQLYYDDNKLLDAVKNYKSNGNDNDGLSDVKWGEIFDWKAIDDEKYVGPLKRLSEKIDRVMDDMKCDNGAFIRLSTRSPKDSALESVKMFEMLFDELKQWDGLNGNDSEYLELKKEQIINSFYRASMKSLCVRNGDQSIELFCRSKRSYVDLSMSMLKQGEQELKIYVIIRKWESKLDSLWEFRLFIKNNQPTALTQYHKNSALPLMYEYKDYIEKGILATFNNIQSNLSDELKDYTIDFAIILDDETKQNNNYVYNPDDSKQSTDNDDEKYNPIQKIWMIEINHEPPMYVVYTLKSFHVYVYPIITYIEQEHHYLIGITKMIGKY